MNHIRSIHDENKSFCGESLGAEFQFKTLEQTFLNGLHYTSIKACKECTAIVIDYLMIGTGAGTEEEIT